MEMHEDKQLSIHVNNLFFTSLISGGLAGVFVDIALFPIDTLKTRLQSEHGFIHSGGFTKLYKGLMPIILGSAPTAALFFVTYESVKMFLIQRVPIEYSPLVHMGSASVAESSKYLNKGDKSFCQMKEGLILSYFIEDIGVLL